MANETKDATEIQKEIEGKTADMYKNVESVQDELGEIEVNGKSDNDLVKITLTGQHMMKTISINPDLLKESNKTVEENIMEAYKDAKDKAEEQVKLKMIEVAKAMGFYEE